MVDKQKSLDGKVETEEDIKRKKHLLGKLIIFFGYFGAGYFLVFSFFYHLFPGAIDFWINLLRPFTEKAANQLPGAVNVINQLLEAGYADRISLVQHSYGVSILLSTTAFISIILSFPIGYYLQGIKLKPINILYTWKESLIALFGLALFISSIYSVYVTQELKLNSTSKYAMFFAFSDSNTFILYQVWIIPLATTISTSFIIFIIYKIIPKKENEPKRIREK